MESLLGEMPDLSRSTRPAAYRTAQFSSYDRASTTPADPATWFANGDAGNAIRTETLDGKTWSVVAEMDGPGAIVHIWMTHEGYEYDAQLGGEMRI